ncbi:hypothetical protein ebA2104 [Aromatoleum aromaticum EbN1]|uniref:Uncharacterized protein n=1 Tax=Aromatoleum aromaticum (strain DSM 19018 / LMG 30748 / EbN1) TaxID=76114 RepID=Q5P5X5_AROAE|nr:hypothetical protein ebA2104 [Aromatoleum aromaticum EbN1]
MEGVIQGASEKRAERSWCPPACCRRANGLATAGNCGSGSAIPTLPDAQACILRAAFFRGLPPGGRPAVRAGPVSCAGQRALRRGVPGEGHERAASRRPGRLFRPQRRRQDLRLGCRRQVREAVG